MVKSHSLLSPDLEKKGLESIIPKILFTFLTMNSQFFYSTCLGISLTDLLIVRLFLTCRYFYSNELMNMQMVCKV